MEHSKGELEVVYTGGVALGAGFAEDIGKSHIHCFRMICNTADKRHRDYHVPKINANAKRLVLCWNTHDELVEALKAFRQAIKLGDVETQDLGTEMLMGEAIEKARKALVKVGVKE